jgi:diguanylate cyclase (GGDEF)-like protein/PAS domain S-box-containing protein
VTEEELATLRRRLHRERAARLEAESIAEQVTRDLYEAAQQLAAAQAVLDETTDFVAITDVDGRATYLNKAYDELLGNGPVLEARPRSDELLTEGTRELFRQDVLPVLESEGSWRGDSFLSAGQGIPIPVSQVLIAHRRSDGQIERISWVSRDISEQRAVQEQLTRQASHDPLTGLANRRFFSQQLKACLASARHAGPPLAVLFIDLDGFKAVNDTLGHDAGDTVLTSVARRLAEHMRETDVLARLGGDEFAVLCPAVGGEDEVSRIAQRLTRAIVQPLDIEGSVVGVGMSTGIALSNGHESSQALLARADAAMYEAKRAGKGHWYLDRVDGVPLPRMGSGSEPAAG